VTDNIMSLYDTYKVAITPGAQKLRI